MKRLYLLLFSLSFIGCASTSITSFKDPAYRDKLLTKILIYVAEDDLKTRFDLEQEFVSILSEHGIPAIESYKLFPPKRKLKEEVMKDSIISNGIDAYLVASIKNSGVETIRLPTTTISKTKGNINTFGDFESKTETTETGGGTFKKPWANIYTKILDAETGNTVWIADASSGGSAFASFRDVYGSYCEEVVSNLFKDRLLISKTYDMIYLKDGKLLIGEIKTINDDRVLFMDRLEITRWIEKEDIETIFETNK